MSLGIDSQPAGIDPKLLNRLQIQTLEIANLKVPKCEMLIAWILMIFYHDVSLSRELEV
jgi:hypothetical protein